jgi:hypothetical protein
MIVALLLWREVIMRYLDYTWDLEPEGIILDEELNLERLGWEDGDIFRFVNVNGKASLLKINPVEKFVRGFSNITENYQGKLQ